MSIIPSHEQRFYENIIDLNELIYELICICYENGYKEIHPSLVKLVGNVLERFDKTKIIDNFINYSNEYWDKIMIHDRSFFIDNARNIFQDLPIDKVDAFKILFTAKDKHNNSLITKEDENSIWDFFDRICIKYIHDKREPKNKLTENGLKPIYTVKFFPDIKLQKYSKHWNVSLQWPNS